jgi:hypothetical protein
MRRSAAGVCKGMGRRQPHTERRYESYGDRAQAPPHHRDGLKMGCVRRAGGRGGCGSNLIGTGGGPAASIQVEDGTALTGRRHAIGVAQEGR